MAFRKGQWFSVNCWGAGTLLEAERTLLFLPFSRSVLCSPLLSQSGYTAAAPSAKSQWQLPHLCALRKPKKKSTEKVQKTFSGAWLPTSSTDLKHWHPRPLICYKFCPRRKMKSPVSTVPSVGCHCCQHHWQISFSGGHLPSFTPLEPRRPPGRQNHTHIPLLHASTDSFDADHFWMRRVADLSYILFKASNTQLLLVKLFSLF